MSDKYFFLAISTVVITIAVGAFFTNENIIELKVEVQLPLPADPFMFHAEINLIDTISTILYYTVPRRILG